VGVDLLTPPLSKQLTTLAILNQELGIVIDPALASRLIDEASERIFLELDRPLYRAQYTEKLAGSGRRRLMLARYPVVSVESVTYAGGAVTLSDVAIEDRDAGFLDYAVGFTWSSDPLAWEVTYTAGYFLPNDELTSFDASVDGTDESFNSATSLFPSLMRAGDSLNAVGFVNSENNGYHTLSSATIAKLITTSDLTTETEVSVSLLIRSLPPLYERTCLDLAKDAYQSLTRSKDLESVKVGDVTLQFSNEVLEKSLASLPGGSQF
jgi:hypothetical protein